MSGNELEVIGLVASEMTKNIVLSVTIQHQDVIDVYSSELVLPGAVQYGALSTIDSQVGTWGSVTPES